MECPFPPLAEIREHPEFHDLMEIDKSSWPRCLLWHGWLPLLSGVNGSSPWAQGPGEGAANLLECALGRYSFDALTEWQLLVGFDAVDDKVSGASSAEAGCFTYRCSRLWADWRPFG